MKRTLLTVLTTAAVAVLSLGLSAASPRPAGAATTLSLTVNGKSSANVTFGNETSVVFAVSINNLFAGGKVTIKTGSTSICTVTLSGGDGQCSPSTETQLAPSASAYSVVASYPGDGLVGPLTSSPVSVTVDQVPTTTTLSAVSPPSPVTYGQESGLTFTAGVTPVLAGTPPTGVIDVDAGTTLLCSITLPATTCSPSGDPLSASATAYGVTAAYAGDTNYAPSTSSSQSLTVDRATTSLTLSVSPATVYEADESTLRVTATPTPQFSGSPSGTITVTATTSALSSSTLCTITLPATTCPTFTNDVLPASGSPYQITASYGGDANFTGSNSNAQTLNVNAGNSTTTLSITPSSTVTYGDEQTVSFDATVTPIGTTGTPTGTVTISASNAATGPTTLCTITLPATSCTAPAAILSASTTAYNVIAGYSGDTTFGASASDPQDLTVQQATTTTSLTPPSASVTYGDQVVFTSTVTPEFSGTPTGTVTVASGPTTLCTFDPSVATGCTATVTALDVSANPYVVVATYGGDTNFASSFSTTTNDLTVSQASTGTGLELSSASVTYGNEQSITFIATVTPQFTGTPTGTVTVATGPTTLCTFDLSTATSCTSTATALAVSAGPYPIVATYGGDTNFASSFSTATNDLTVTQASTGTGLELSSSTVAYGNEQSVTFTAIVTPQFAGSPTGTVTVTTGATTLCTISLPTATPTCTTSPQTTTLAASGTPYAVTATYPGDGNFTGSQTTSPSDLTVGQAATSTSLGAAPTSVAYGSGSPVTFTVSVQPAFSGSPTGTVTVGTGATTLCTFMLPTATPRCSASLSSVGAGVYTVTASYPGDPDFQSSSGTFDVTVNPATASSPSIADLPTGAAEEGAFTAEVVTNGDGARSVTSDTPNNCTVEGDGLTVRFLVEGSCTLTPQVSSGHDYAGASGSPQTFTIGPGPRGYWLVGSDGGIFSFGAAQFHGSMGGTRLQRPVVGITPTASKNGYWLVASDGGIFAFGDAGFFGSIPELGLNPAGSGLPHSLSAPIVGMVPSHDGGGYFQVASDGGVFAFGDARFAGSCPGIGGCSGAAVAVMPDASGNGYWLVTSAGAVYTFGDAPYFGSPPAQSSAVVSAVATPDGGGYWILYANGVVLGFGDAHSYGDPVGYVTVFNPATSVFPTTDGLGYWVASAKGDVFSFGNAPFLGSMSSTPLNGPIIAAFGF